MQKYFDCESLGNESVCLGRSRDVFDCSTDHGWMCTIYSIHRENNHQLFSPSPLKCLSKMSRLSPRQEPTALRINSQMDKRDNAEMSMRFSNQHTIHDHCCCHHWRMQNLRPYSPISKSTIKCDVRKRQSV